MTDLDELFRPLIDEGAAHREPIDVIALRAHDLRSRRRRLRAQYRLGAAFVAVALIAATIGVVHAQRDTVSRRAPIATTTPPPTSAPTSATPTGWTAYDYGRARISIPPGWTTAENCVPAGGDILVLDDPHFSPTCTAPPIGAPLVAMSPLRAPTVHTPYLTNAEVNGIPYERVLPKCVSRACPSLIADVPALGVAVSFRNVTGDSILKTLTYSTYARILQQPFGPAPASWKSVTFDGFTVRVPASWPVVDLSKTWFCAAEANTAYVGTPGFSEQCASAFALGIRPPEASLQIAPIAVGASNMPGFAFILHHNGLRVAREAVDHPFVREMTFTVEGGGHQVELTLGLGVDAAVARGILGSVRAVAP